jgi:hypothetical protein
LAAATHSECRGVPLPSLATAHARTTTFG